jgi:hypothetical protein
VHAAPLLSRRLCCLQEVCQIALSARVTQTAAASTQGSEQLSAIWCFATEPGLRKMREAVLTVIAQDIAAFGYRTVHMHLSITPMWEGIQKDELLFILEFNNTRSGAMRTTSSDSRQPAQVRY